MPGQDLTRVTIPSFFLEPRSLLERLVRWPHERFSCIARISREQMRPLAALFAAPLAPEHLGGFSASARCALAFNCRRRWRRFLRPAASQADTLMHPDVLLRSAQAAEPLERMKLVVAWFLSGFHYKTVVRGAGRAPTHKPGRAPLPLLSTRVPPPARLPRCRFARLLLLLCARRA